MSSSIIPIDVWNKLAWDLLATNPVDLANFGKTSTWATRIVARIFNETVSILSSRIPIISIIKPLYTHRQQAQMRLSELGADGGPIERAYQQISQAEAAYGDKIEELKKNPSLEFFEAQNNVLTEIQFNFINATKKYRELIVEQNRINGNLANFPFALAAMMSIISRAIRN